MPSLNRKSNDEKELAPIPPWAWGFAVACVMIPVVAIGGAIPTALGFGAAAYCLFSAREGAKSVKFRMVRCSVVTAASWGAFFLLAAAVFSIRGGGGAETVARSSHSARPAQARVATVVEDPGTDLSNESIRREIYAKATRMLGSLDDAEDRLRESRRKGRSTNVPQKQVDHIRGMYESDLEFTMKWYEISREQLDDVLDEGDRMGWPKR